MYTPVYKCRAEYVKSVVGEGNFFTTLQGWIVIEGEHAGCPEGYRIYMHKWKFAKKSDGSIATFIPLTYLVKMADGYRKIHQKEDLRGIPVHKDEKGEEYLQADLGWGPWTAEAPSLQGVPPWENIMKEGDANSDEYTARRRLLGFFRRPLGSFPGQEPADKHHTDEEEWGSDGVKRGWKLVRLRLEQNANGTPIVYLTEWQRRGHYPPQKYYPGDPDIPEGVFLRGPLNVEKRKKFGWIDPLPPSVLGKHSHEDDGESVDQVLEAEREKIRLMKSLAATQNFTNANTWIEDQHEKKYPTTCVVCLEEGPHIMDNFGIFVDKDNESCGHQCCGKCAEDILKDNSLCPQCRRAAVYWVKVKRVRK